MSLEDLGLIGWEKIELTLMSALMQHLPILLVGSHGACKTDAAVLLSKLFYGCSVKVKKYDTPFVQNDDLLGWPDMRSLADGQVDYIHTPSCLWDAEVVIFDELNRANPLTASKLLEVIRKRQAMGMKTEIQQVFAAINPPAKYDAQYLDLANASRWVVVEVPDTGKLSQDNVIKALGTEDDEDGLVTDSSVVSRMIQDIAAASRIELPKTTNQAIRDMVGTILKSLSTDLIVSIRQGKSMIRLLEAAHKISSHKAKGSKYSISSNKQTALVCSCIPQMHGITRTKLSTNTNQISTTVSQIIAAVSSSDGSSACMLHKDVVALLKDPDKSDRGAFAAALVNAIDEEKDLGKLKEAGLFVLTAMDPDKDASLFNTVVDHLMVAMSNLEMPNLDKLWLTNDRVAVHQLTHQVLGRS